MRILITFCVIVLLYCSKNNPVQSTENLIEGVWYSDTITSQGVANYAEGTYYNRKQSIDIRFMSTIAEFKINFIDFMSSKDSMWNNKISFLVISAESWDNNEDSVYLYKSTSSTGGQVANPFKFKYKYVDNNEIWIYWTATDYNNKDNYMWTWYKCKK